MKALKSLSFILSITTAAFLFSCKKDNPPVATATPNYTQTESFTPEMLKDSALAISRDIYLWYEQIPASFNAHSYDDPNKEMEGLHPYSIEPGFSQAVDRWSFAMKKTEWDAYSGGMSTLSTGLSANGDLGLTVFFRVEGDLRVRLVEPNSPAGIAGVRRGWRIASINGNSNINTANSSFIVNNIYYAQSAAVRFIKPDGTETTITLDAAHYTDKPVYLDTVYQFPGKRVGYLVLNSFLGDQNQVNNDLQAAFTHFGNQAITDLVIDLRYNGGGYVSLQETVANYLANSQANGSMMMKQEYNSKNTQQNRTSNFHKLGSLDLSKIYFITTSSTASASELLINNLRPYMDVRLVGSKTHGKPVGFFPIPVGEWYIFPVSFRTVNKNGQGNYFNGLPVNSQVADGLDKDWGDTDESSLASALNNILSGSYRTRDEKPYTEDPAVNSGNTILEKPFLKIAVETRQ